MSIGLLTSTIQVLKKVTDQAQPYMVSIGEGITTIMNPGKDFSHLSQKKTRWQLFRLSAAVCGIELCYAAETAFVSPILLKLGIPVSLMTLMWCASPLLGFFLVPLLGSMSDRCRLRYGRRRPFILILSAGIVIGLILVPNGETLGNLIGSIGSTTRNNASHPNLTSINDSYSGQVENDFLQDISKNESQSNSTWIELQKVPKTHIYGIILTAVGVALLDFSSDACQSPCRAYLLDVSISEDHSAGLTSFTVLAGLGGSIGYVFGGIDWNKTNFGQSFGGHIRLVFTAVLIAYVIFVFVTITSFKEVPLDEISGTAEHLQKKKKKKGKGSKYKKFVNEDSDEETLDYDKYDETKTRQSNGHVKSTYGTIDNNDPNSNDPNRQNTNEIEAKKNLRMFIDKKSSRKYSLDEGKLFNTPYTNPLANGERRYSEGSGVLKGDNLDVEKLASYSTEVTLKTYLLSIFHMPRSIMLLCLTNLFCWMSLVCYSLYFTDYVGQTVFGGDPKAPIGSEKHDLYDEGVRLGSFGMSLYSLSCALYSMCIEKLVEKFRAKKVYIGGQLVYTTGMIIMACTRSRVTAVILSPCAGIMYATLFTMPYLILANYHTNGQFELETKHKKKQVRGLGTDIALVSSMVFLAQFLLSAFLGMIIQAVGSTVAIVVAAAILSFLGAISASQVMYLDL